MEEDIVVSEMDIFAIYKANLVPFDGSEYKVCDFC
jgi:hypothetical protein